jgi:hypothetical protein
MTNIEPDPCVGLTDSSLAKDVPVKCIQKLVVDAGCSKDGPLYPPDNFFGWWNNSPNGATTVYCDGNNPWPKCGAGNFGTIKSDIKAWGTLTSQVHVDGCKGPDPCVGINDNTKASQVPVTCLQRTWINSGCKKEGTLYPPNDYNGWWRQDNGAGTFGAIKNDMAAWGAKKDMDGLVACKGIEGCESFNKTNNEVFHIGNYDKSWGQADAKCKEYNARLATRKELDDAFNAGANWCSSGHLKDSDPSYPTQVARDGCGVRGVNVYGNPNDLRGANCYGIKPAESTQNILPFNSTKWSQYSPDNEAFHIGGYDKTRVQAQAKCKEFGARLATRQEITDAFNYGADWCSSGHTSDSDPVFPIQVPRSGCGAKAVNTYGSVNDLRGANCYGMKPPQNTPGILPFNPEKWSQHSPPSNAVYMNSDYSECIEKVWKQTKPNNEFNLEGLNAIIMIQSDVTKEEK